MINEERVILMTKMQAYEDGEGRKNVAIANYFRGDYLGYQVLKAIICITIALAMVYAGYVVYDFENFMKMIYQIDLMAYGKRMLTIYLICTGIYALITYVVSAYRYTKAKKSLKRYYGNLKKLNAMYKEE